MDTIDVYVTPWLTLTLKIITIELLEELAYNDKLKKHHDLPYNADVASWLTLK